MYVIYFNQAHTHPGIGQQIPGVIEHAATPDLTGQPLFSRPVLGGLHHDYRRVA
jgi:hypothetical protein